MARTHSYQEQQRQQLYEQPGNSTIVTRTYGTRRASLIASSRNRVFKVQPPIMWNIQGMRGQMSSNCLWHACKAFVLGLLIFSGGAAMCVAGFYIDGVLGDYVNSTSTTQTSSSTSSTEFPYQPEQTGFYQVDPSRPRVQFSKLSYAGPIIMGIGGFIIVATCVMTCEARDSAAKVGPSFGASSSFTTNSASSAAAKNVTAIPLAIPLLMNSSNSNNSSNRSKSRSARNRSFDVRSVASQTIEGGSTMSLAGGGGGGSTTTTSTLPIFDKKIIVDAFKKFSRTLRTSASIASSNAGDEEQIQRYPSAPSLLNTNVNLNQQQQVNSGSATTGMVNKKSPFLARSRRIKQPPAALRAMSIDSHSPVTSPPPVNVSAKQEFECKTTTASKQKRKKRFKRNLSVPIDQLETRQRKHKDNAANSSMAAKDAYYYNYNEQIKQELSKSPKFESSSLPGPSIQKPQSLLQPEHGILRNVNASVHRHPVSPAAEPTSSGAAAGGQIIGNDSSLIKPYSNSNNSSSNNNGSRSLVNSFVPHYKLRTQSEDLPGASHCQNQSSSSMSTSSTNRLGRYLSEQEPRPMLTRQPRVTTTVQDHHYEIIYMPNPAELTTTTTTESISPMICYSTSPGSNKSIAVSPNSCVTTTILEENESEG